MSEEQAAMEYVAFNIFRCAGCRKFIIDFLGSGNKTEAFRVFKACFRDYGFSDLRYSFFGDTSKGKIKREDGYEIEVTSKQLFDVLVIYLEREVAV